MWRLNFSWCICNVTTECWCDDWMSMYRLNVDVTTERPCNKRHSVVILIDDCFQTFTTNVYVTTKCLVTLTFSRDAFVTWGLNVYVRLNVYVTPKMSMWRLNVCVTRDIQSSCRHSRRMSMWRLNVYVTSCTRHDYIPWRILSTGSKRRVCCSVLQCVDRKQMASVLQCVAVSCSMLGGSKWRVFCSVLQCVAVC